MILEIVAIIRENDVMVECHNLIGKTFLEKLFDIWTVARQEKFCISLFYDFDKLLQCTVFGKVGWFDVTILILSVTPNTLRILRASTTPDVQSVGETVVVEFDEFLKFFVWFDDILEIGMYTVIIRGVYHDTGFEPLLVGVICNFKPREFDTSVNIVEFFENAGVGVPEDKVRQTESDITPSKGLG